MEIVLENISAKLGTEDICTPIIGDASLYANSNESDIKSYKLCHEQKIIKSAVLQHRNIRRYCLNEGYPIVFL